MITIFTTDDTADQVEKKLCRLDSVEKVIGFKFAAHLFGFMKTKNRKFKCRV